jgi:acetyl-CoA synthetase
VYRVNAANVQTIVCAEDAELCEKVRLAAQEAPLLRRLYNVRKPHEGFVQLDAVMADEPESFPRAETVATEPMLLYFTSGTTGHPKMVMHNYTYPLAHIVTANYWHCVQNDGLHLTVADTGWAKASWGKIYGQWLCGSAIMVYDYERFDGEAMMNVLEKYEVTTFCAPPTVYRLMTKSGLRPEAFRSVKHVSTAGEALQKEIIRLFRENTGLEIMEGYGQTETTLIIGNFAGGKPKRGSMGKPSPQYKVMLVDGDDNPVPTGETGEIVIDVRERVPEGLCMYYENNDEANERYWKNGLYRTGDTAYCDEEGYYFYVGRTDDIIKSSGYRIGPFEVESALIKHPAVVECAVTGVPDEQRGNLIKASVVLSAGYEPTDALAKELQQFVKERTAPYKYPRIVEFVTELPKTISGKIRYNVIRDNDNKKA